MKEHLYVDSISLDPAIYLRRIQTLQGYFKDKGC